MKKLIIISIIMLMLTFGFMIISQDIKVNDEIKYSEPIYEEKNNKGNVDVKYQGPVPEGYDLEYFRKTGEIRKDIIIKNLQTTELWNSVREYENRELNIRVNK